MLPGKRHDRSNHMKEALLMNLINALDLNPTALRYVKGGYAMMIPLFLMMDCFPLHIY